MNRYDEMCADDPPGTCTNGCGMPEEDCICKPVEPRIFETLTAAVRKAEASITRADLEGVGCSWEDWQRIRQWPEDG